MRRVVGILGILAVLSIGSTPFSLAGEKSAQMGSESKEMPASARTISGTLLKIDGEFYVVEEPTGKEVRLHVSEDTKQLGGAKQPGDPIRAEATKDGHAISIQ